jgi:hypothetical protein
MILSENLSKVGVSFNQISLQKVVPGKLFLLEI